MVNQRKRSELVSNAHGAVILGITFIINMFGSLHRNADVTDGDCSQFPSGGYLNIFDWVKQSSYAGYHEFLNLDTWAYSADVSKITLLT